MKFTGQIVWITGASSGIGEALALEFARMGAELVLSARNTDKLEKVKSRCEELGPPVTIVPLDLSDPASIGQAFEKVRNQAGRVDILINNAGLSQRSPALETSRETERKIMETNFFGPVQLTRLVGGLMKDRRRGHIVVVSSIAGKFGFPLRSVYSASKHALQGYFETLWAELKPLGVAVTIVSPGRVKTNISLNAIGPDGKPHGQMDEGQANGISPEECARKIIKAIAGKKKDVLIGGKELLLVYIHRYLRFLYYRIVTKVKAT